MVTIPKITMNNITQATAESKELVAKFRRMSKKEVINPIKLVRTPVSDSFEKKSYMETDSFWNKSQNFANYARGQYFAENGKAIQEEHKVGETVIARTAKLERGFRIEPSTEDKKVIYYEKNLLNGRMQSIELVSGKPYKSYFEDQRFNILYHDPETGVPTKRVQSIVGGGGGKIITDYAADGETVVNTTHIASGARK